MANSLLFFTHILILFFFIAGALKVGKHALMALVAIQALLANLFVTKQVILFGLEVTATDPFIVGSIIALGLVQEFFGKKAASQTIVLSIGSMLFFTLLGKFHLLYTPGPHDQMQLPFTAILSNTPRIFVASIIALFTSLKTDAFIFSLLKNRKRLLPLSLRLMISSALSQAMDTTLFSFLALYGIAHSLFSIILISFTIKCIAIFSLSHCTTLFKKMLPKVP